MNVCYDQAGRNIGLADHALASGEGAVYEIVGYPRKVVKKYHHGADAKKREDVSSTPLSTKIYRTGGFCDWR